MQRPRVISSVLGAVLAGALGGIAAPSALAAPVVDDGGLARADARPQAPTRVLVRFKDGARAAERADARRDAGTRFEETLPVRGLQVVDPQPGVSVGQAVTRLEREPAVAYAEADAPRRVAGAPNDRFFSLLWGLHNVGQTVAGTAGSPDADVDGPEAWDLTTGSPAAPIGVIDSGADTSHPDLTPNLWTNPGESGNGRETNGADDDRNGVADDVHGWDWVEDDAAPNDLDGHGTHVAGTIAARGNDGAGVAGVAWSSNFVPLRVLGADGTGSLSDVVEAYGYARRTGLRVVNASLGGEGFSRAEHDAIAGAPNTLFVVAAGNGGRDGIGDDNDVVGDYPCSYDLANVVCVAASDSRDALAGFSNFGVRSVDLAAPGVNVASTWPGADWVYLDGTSMASPHVAGAAALVLARDPGASVADVRRALLDNVDQKTSLAARTATGGRLNAQSLGGSPAPGPGTTQPVSPSPAPPPTPPAPAPAADALPPSLSITTPRAQRLSTVLRRGLRPRLGVSEPATVKATLEVSARTAKRLGLGRGRRAVRIAATTKNLTAGAFRVTVKLRRTVKRKLARARAVATTLRVSASDPARNSGSRSRRVTLRR